MDMDAILDTENVILTFREVDPSSWPDLEQLFESRGGPKYCWCMVWRATPKELKGNAQVHKAALKHRVDTAIPIGIVGYLDQEPVAWCSIAPRTTFRNLGGIEDRDRRKCLVIDLLLREKAPAREGYHQAVDQCSGSPCHPKRCDHRGGLPGRPGITQLSFYGIR